MRPLGWLAPETRGRAPHRGLRINTSLDGLLPRVLLAPLPPVYDQGGVGSCTAQALAAGIEVLLARAGYPAELPDRVALYRRERELLGTTQEDSGAILADGVGVLRCGWEPERAHEGSWGSLWTAPAPALARDAPRLVSAEPLDQDPATIAWELATGSPVVVGLQVTDAWDRPEDPVLPEPAGDTIGGHALVLVGYDLPARLWRCRNSWGVAWGDEGYCWLPWHWTAPPWCGEAHALRAVRRAP